MRLVNSVAVSLLFIFLFVGCRSTQKIRTSPTSIVHEKIESATDSLRDAGTALYRRNDSVLFKTFSAKVKVEYADAGGSQPDANATIRMIKDSAIWISVTATFLNIEAFRVFITKDSIIILDRLEKTIDAESIRFLQEKIDVPFSFDDLQRLIAGRLVLISDSLLAVNKAGDYLQLIFQLPQIRNEAFFKMPEGLLAKQSIFLNESENPYSAEVLLDNYEKSAMGPFATSRIVSIPAKEQLLKLTFRQYEFNNELSLPFNRPSGYTIK